MLKVFIALTCAVLLSSCQHSPCPYPNEEAKALVLSHYLGTKYPGCKVLLISTPWSLHSEKTKVMVEQMKKNLGDKNVQTGAIIIHDDGTRENVRLGDLINAKEFDELADQHPDCNVIISMVGLPGDKQKMKLWNDPKRHIAMLSISLINNSRAISDGKVVAAVALKPGSSKVDIPPDLKPEQRFSLRYILVTPQNIGELQKKYPLLIR